MYIIFNLCYDVIAFISSLLGVSDDIVSTILFIYIEPLILDISALAACFYIWKNHEKKPKFFTLLYLLPYLILSTILYCRYLPMGMQGSCEQAYKDLYDWGNTSGIGYESINVLLFIITFIIMLCINFTIIAWERKSKRLKNIYDMLHYRLFKSVK
mgnify:CR=1 FL=1